MCRKLFIVLLTVLSLCSQSQPAFSASIDIRKSAALGIRKLFAGAASFYADCFHGKRTASGERFDQNKLTCAHRYLPFGTRLLVENPENGNVVVVTVNDRGPFHGNRVIDLSRAAARRLGITGIGNVVCYTGKGVERASLASIRKIGELTSLVLAINTNEPTEETVTVVRRTANSAGDWESRDRMQLASSVRSKNSDQVNSSRPAIEENY